jgi:Fe2+ transport system protein FeoA
MEIGGLLHTDYQSTRAKLTALGLNLGEPVKLKNKQPHRL